MSPFQPKDQIFVTFADQLLDPDKERAYREHHSRSDVNQATVFMFLSFLPILITPINKMNYLRDNTEDGFFISPVVIFLMAAVLICAFIFAIRNFRSVKAFDAVLFVYMLVFGTMLVVNQYFRPADYVGTMYILYIFHNAFLMPTPLRVQVIPTTLYSCAMILIIVLMREPTYRSESVNAVLAICTFSVFGFFCARFLGRTHRLRYLDFVRERDLRAELEESLVTIKRLSGILPICSHCFNIRDEDDTWHRIEGFVQNRSDARFSHTICPTCVVTHYPDGEQ